ncbi:MAG: hypothetical protein ACR2KS_08945 [Candidatus Eremiobacter antarcticus]|nr:hypothetical protein [Candidatus Eremiobacteraeota bacterium]
MRTPFLQRKTQVGHQGRFKDPLGKRHKSFLVVDEVEIRQHNAPHKLIVIQKCLINGKDREFRLAYWIEGKKPGVRGRLVFGQYALLIPSRDLRKLISKAQKKWGKNFGW